MPYGLWTPHSNNMAYRYRYLSERLVLLTDTRSGTVRGKVGGAVAEYEVLKGVSFEL